jgi:hypothetical protein
MGYFRLGSLVAALALLTVWAPEPAQAGAAAMAIEAKAPNGAAVRIDRPVLHQHRKQSFYCYPKTNWWFYRPYTTAPNGHARCMPYFHYLGPDARGAKSQRYAK